MIRILKVAASPQEQSDSGSVSRRIVVEAAVTGGALITANQAMEYGISVFAVPGDVDRETSVGGNSLI
jgi:DNA processing protein